MSDALVTMIEKMAFKLEEVEVERDALKQKLAEQEAAWQQDLRTGARALRERDELRSLLKDGFAYVRDANRLMAADGDLDEEDEDGANEWLEKAAAALVEG